MDVSRPIETETNSEDEREIPLEERIWRRRKISYKVEDTCGKKCYADFFVDHIKNKKAPKV